MFGIGHTELIIFMLVALILFGHRLPQVMRNLGQSLTEFRRGLKTSGDEPLDPA